MLEPPRLPTPLSPLTKRTCYFVIPSCHACKLDVSVVMNIKLDSFSVISDVDFLTLPSPTEFLLVSVVFYVLFAL